MFVKFMDIQWNADTLSQVPVARRIIFEIGFQCSDLEAIAKVRVREAAESRWRSVPSTEPHDLLHLGCARPVQRHLQHLVDARDVVRAEKLELNVVSRGPHKRDIRPLGSSEGIATGDFRIIRHSV